MLLIREKALDSIATPGLGLRGQVLILDVQLN